MPEGIYAYCILDGGNRRELGKIGISSHPVYSIPYKDISAAVSDIPLKKMEPNVNDVVAHNRVVEAARKAGTVIPIRFGVIFRTRDGITKLLKVSYKDFKSKINKLKGKDEFGLKIVFEKAKIAGIERAVQEESEECRKIRAEIAKAGPGASYFLDLRLKELVKSGALKKIEKLGDDVHKRLEDQSDEALLLQSDVDEVILNATYLVRQDRSRQFTSSLDTLQREYESSGLTFHLTGPWAPYSFC